MVTAIDMGRALVGAVALERLAELAVTRRNARRLLARGGIEAGRGHYPAMVAFHAALLAACLIEPALRPARWPVAIAIIAAALVLLAQALRWWVVWALDGRWSTRIIVLPGAPPVRSGPYRWLRHPNYLAVIVEVAALPLAVGAWRTALVASALNAALLAVRIGAEERAMGAGWGEAFKGVARFVPGLAPAAAADATVADPVSVAHSASDEVAAPATGTAPAAAADAAAPVPSVSASATASATASGTVTGAASASVAKADPGSIA